ncbi:MAG: SDR family oxidoreductase [Candidatus Acidiferrum sp.]
MTQFAAASSIHSAFVTGSTGLLGNNLVRFLVSRGVKVKALARSKEKAKTQFGDLPVEIVEGDMENVAAFAHQLRDIDVIFHTAAYFRDSYKGGKHWRQLYRINVDGTADLFTHSYASGARRIVHTSSVAVLTGAPGQPIDETMLRTAKDADDYYLSKILTDRKIASFLEKHPDMWACMVLPGWMVGPGDLGPTSSGQVILDFLHRKLPGIPPATFSVVDARDVAEAHWLAAMKGRRGERYLAAGRHMSMADFFRALEQVSGVRSPKFSVPPPLLFLMGAATELWARISGRPALISLATVRLMMHERNRTLFTHEKSERELGLTFRPVQATLQDTIAWYRKSGWLQKVSLNNVPLHTAGVSPC